MRIVLRTRITSLSRRGSAASTPDITVSLAGTNVTGQKTRNFESREDFVREVRNDDTTYSLGVRFNF